MRPRAAVLSAASSCDFFIASSICSFSSGEGSCPGGGGGSPRGRGSILDRSSSRGSKVLGPGIRDLRISNPRRPEGLGASIRGSIEDRASTKGSRRGFVLGSTGTPLDEKACRLKWVPRDARTAPSLKKPCSCARRSPRSHADEPSAAWPLAWPSAFLRASNCL